MEGMTDDGSKTKSKKKKSRNNLKAVEVGGKIIRNETWKSETTRKIKTGKMVQCMDRKKR